MHANCAIQRRWKNTASPDFASLGSAAGTPWPWPLNPLPVHRGTTCDISLDADTLDPPSTPSARLPSFTLKGAGYPDTRSRVTGTHHHVSSANRARKRKCRPDSDRFHSSELSRRALRISCRGRARRAFRSVGTARCPTSRPCTDLQLRHRCCQPGLRSL